jgi:hypothetical protein
MSVRRTDVEKRSGVRDCIEKEGSRLAPQLRIAIEPRLPTWIAVSEVRIGKRVAHGAMPLVLSDVTVREGVGGGINGRLSVRLRRASIVTLAHACCGIRRSLSCEGAFNTAVEGSILDSSFDSVSVR